MADTIRWRASQDAPIRQDSRPGPLSSPQLAEALWISLIANKQGDSPQGPHCAHRAYKSRKTPNLLRGVCVPYSYKEAPKRTYIKAEPWSPVARPLLFFCKIPNIWARMPCSMHFSDMWFQQPLSACYVAGPLHTAHRFYKSCWTDGTPTVTSEGTISRSRPIRAGREALNPDPQLPSC